MGETLVVMKVELNVCDLLCMVMSHEVIFFININGGGDDGKHMNAEAFLFFLFFSYFS